MRATRIIREAAAALAVVLLGAGCASLPATSVDAIVEADDARVADCRYLGDVNGRAASGATRGQDVPGKTAKADALNRAARLGATHVVWYGATDIDLTRAEGRAYECRTPH